MATHSSILAWRIPWTEKPGRLQSMGLQRVHTHTPARQLTLHFFTRSAKPAVLHLLPTLSTPQPTLWPARVNCHSVLLLQTPTWKSPPCSELSWEKNSEGSGM